MILSTADESIQQPTKMEQTKEGKNVQVTDFIISNRSTKHNCVKTTIVEYKRKMVLTQKTIIPPLTFPGPALNFVLSNLLININTQT